VTGNSAARVTVFLGARDTRAKTCSPSEVAMNAATATITSVPRHGMT
jgi:hypothetical protein